MATKQEMLEAAIDLLAEIRNDGPNVLALCQKISLMADPNDGVTLGDTRNMKQGVYKDTIAQAIHKTGSTDADIVYMEFDRLAGLRGHTRESFDRFLPEVLEAMRRTAAGRS
jgi:hypothetical protein